MPRLYRSPGESPHWLVWTEDLGWFRFPITPQASQVPLQMAFNNGLIEFFERCIRNGAA